MRGGEREDQEGRERCGEREEGERDGREGGGERGGWGWVGEGREIENERVTKLVMASTTGEYRYN